MRHLGALSRSNGVIVRRTLWIAALTVPAILSGCSSPPTGVIEGTASPSIGVGSAKPIHFTVSLLTGDLSSSSTEITSQAETADAKNQWHPTYRFSVPTGEYTLVSSPEGPATGAARGAPTFAKNTLTPKQLRSPPFQEGKESWGPVLSLPCTSTPTERRSKIFRSSAGLRSCPGENLSRPVEIGQALGGPY
jgi:hypothetical protein